MYSLRIIEDKDTWDDFVVRQQYHTFLHAWAWGEMQETLGERVWRWGVFFEGTLCGVMLAIKIHARRGDFLFVPHGPILSHNDHPDPKIFEVLVGELKKIAREEGVAFIRISPPLKNTQEMRALFQGLGFRDAPIHMHPEITWTLPLEKSEQELLVGMRKTTRNLIRRAEREDVEISIGANEQDLEDFYTLYQQTAAKQHFVAFSREYLSAELEAFNFNNKEAAPTQGQPEAGRPWVDWSASGAEPNAFGSKGAVIILGSYRGKVQAGAFIVFFGNAGFYHHGASALEDPKIPVPYLVQWAAIQEAKKRGKGLYNFWGIVPQENSLHPWAGLTLFKMGFGGFRTDYLHAQDLPLSWKYWINWAVETIRRRRRGY